MESQSMSHALTLADWKLAYLDGQRPTERLGQLLASLDQADCAWISLASAEQLQAQLHELDDLLAEAGGDLDKLPLYGVPFAIKDNIDAAGWPTTAACPGFSHIAGSDAQVVARLRKAGAVLIGKTNLDQFATGLVGTRSPYGEVPNSFDPAYVSGGSSSGSASVVARGLVPFSLGTDTAGSGRVPAGFNNIVGLKPSKGWLSTSGLLPACRTLDCISVFALSVADAASVAALAGGYDAADPYSRRNPNSAPVGMGATPRFAVPDTLEFFGDSQARAAHEQALERLAALGVKLQSIDFTPFRLLAEQLYQGAWVAERTVALENVDAEQIEPVVRGIVANGHDYSACDAYRAEYRRAELSRRINDLLAGFDALVVPTSPTIRTRAQMAEEPVLFNSQFGTYTNFTNLADLCALALPASLRADGLPAGITLIAPAWHDQALSAFGQRWQAHIDLPLGATGRRLPALAGQPAAAAPGSVRLAVVGAHLTGMPLNFQLTSRDAVLVEQTLTSADYRLYALAGSVPPKPGLARAEDGVPIIVELWDIPLARFGEFVAEIPAPLGIGNLTLADGRSVKGFICEPWALRQARDITAFGGWRAFISGTTPCN
ncbi:allophanate hydrolase [Stutzerimonas kirkiae]|uniref:Allophanate hydrolase n=2 Tax=Stutzerimonas kirkiae TaxID=2211392 RepID=A0A4Q9QYT9_9GAMM|nr:allophanate hydrolase [Stutzerimonas kirkiae]TBU90654.1 allophanate hydrolase [Stutzerimonas kirkiae]TBV00166.1 allophanate hydrolase [Stutzerimonas kirkiae]TBV14055.1 allophanate hydrolase [Stutzerimonas kirkiae]